MVNLFIQIKLQKEGVKYQSWSFVSIWEARHDMLTSFSVFIDCIKFWYP